MSRNLMTIWLNQNNYFVEFINNYFVEYKNNSLNQNNYFFEYIKNLLNI